MRRKPPAPRPKLVRRPSEPFGWLEARLLHGGWLERVGPEGTAVLLLLALAADERGASFYSRVRMRQRLGLSAKSLDRALQLLLELRLVAFRPWQPGHSDGVWQRLPLPEPQGGARGGGPMSVAEILQQLGARR